MIEEAVQAGQMAFGENRVQEAEEKIPQSRHLGICWHLVGHLQSNKARTAASIFDVVQSIDSAKIALRLGRYCADLHRTLPVFVEVNVGAESQKSGVPTGEARALLEVIDSVPSLDAVGLMCIPPYHENPEHMRPYFRRLARLMAELNQYRDRKLTQLSMGMSGDYRVAIEEGATLLRIGTAIFGPRS